MANLKVNIYKNLIETVFDRYHNIKKEETRRILEMYASLLFFL